jgi:hypothetical protein
MTGLDDDRELDDFLARRSTLHRRLADRDRADPPPELDRLVLDRAREAIQTPTNLAVHRAPRWAVPVALAASIVIAFTVVVNMGRMGHRGARVASSASTAADAAAARMAETGESIEAGRPTATAASANQLRIQMEKRAASPAAPPMVAFDAKGSAIDSAAGVDSRASSETSTALLADASAPGAAAAHATDGAGTYTGRGRASESALAKSRVATDAALTSGEPLRSSAPALAQSRVAAPAVAMPHAVAKASGAAEAPQSLVASNTAQREGAYLEPASAPRSAYAPAPSEHRAIVPAKSEMTASNAVVDRAERESAARTGSLEASDRAPVAQNAGAPVATAAPPLARTSPSPGATGPTTDARSSAGAAASADSAPLSAATTSVEPTNTPAPTTEAKHANPQAWLREIEALRSAGKTAEANRELAEFRKAFPNEATQLPPQRDSRPVQ